MEPTEKQLRAIQRLARAAKASVNLNKIASKQEASRIIDELLGKLNGKKSSRNDCDRKVAYGLATKLVFFRYNNFKIDYNTDKFWEDVDEFYREYFRRQSRAVSSA
jgi:hypothetical protein